MKMRDVLLHSTQVRILTKVVSVLTSPKFGLKWFPPSDCCSASLLSLHSHFLSADPLTHFAHSLARRLKLICVHAERAINWLSRDYCLQLKHGQSDGIGIWQKPIFTLF